MAVRRTVARCPADTEVQEGCGIPWGATMVPFAAVDENGRAPEQGEHGQLLPRCESCWAYLNCLCDVDKWAWTCSLCGNLNAFSDDMSARYQTSQGPELSSSFIDLELDGMCIDLNFCKVSLFSLLQDVGGLSLLFPSSENVTEMEISRSEAPAENLGYDILTG